MTWFVHIASAFVKFLASGRILLHLDAWHATLAVLCVMERVSPNFGRQQTTGLHHNWLIYHSLGKDTHTRKVL